MNEVKSTLFADEGKPFLILTHPGEDHLSLVVLPRPVELAIIESDEHPDAQKEEGQSKSKAQIASDPVALHPIPQSEVGALHWLLHPEQDALEPVVHLLGNLVVHVAPCTSDI